MAADTRAKFQKEAEKYMQQGKISQAIGEYLKILRIHPDDVLTLNTVGDLYLSQGRTAEANNFFKKVADNYVRNNFFLKAIAVYKKILQAESDCLDINETIASLYVRQGLHTDACNQYLRLVGLYERAGNQEAIVKAYGKIVELDPANATVQKKLAEIFLENQETAKGREHLLKAARAMAKSLNHSGAMDCYRRALQINPLDIDGLKGFKECCLKTGKVSTILDQLNESLKKDPDNLDIMEMLGEAHLAGDDPEAAAEILKTVISSDESRHACLAPAIAALIEHGKFDKAAESLDPIIPVLITRRKTELAVQFCEQILQRCNLHMPTMQKLASLHLAAGDMPRYLEVLDKIADFYVAEKNPSAALECLEKILQVDPESEKHLDLHKVAFVDAHPDTPYVPPKPPPETHVETGSARNLAPGDDKSEDAPESIVEADLLINYGMKGKALGLLRNLESRDPNDRKVRSRLLTLYKEDEKFTEAAEQALLLAVLYKRTNDGETADKYLSEAKQLDPDLFEREHDLDLFARKRGILTDDAGSGSGLKSDMEVDLSGDLLDIFFTGKKDGIPDALSGGPPNANEVPEGYAEGLASHPPTQSIEEKLQEVDFYIRLGFKDEAQNKLNEIAKINPDHPELPQRYEKLEEMESSEDPADTAAIASDDEDSVPAEDLNEEIIHTFQGTDGDGSPDDFSGLAVESDDPAESADFSSLHQLDDAFEFQMQDTAAAESHAAAGNGNGEHESLDFAALDQLDDAAEFEVPSSWDFGKETHAEAFGTSPESKEAGVNDMFSDLIDEVSALNDQEIEKENFEDHFSLGTAFRDMDLVEEAIKEFQTALRIAEHSKDTHKLIQCCGMLSTCFIKKSMPHSALRWCQTGLNVSHISPQEALAFRYDMGVSHAMEGNPELALQCFDQIFNMDPGYRDVAVKIDEIKSGRREI